MRGITVGLRGGLGNQMFQYAAGRAAMLRTATQLALDVRRLTASGDRNYGLEDFRLCPDLTLITEGPPPRQDGRWRRLLKSLIGGEPCFHEAGFPFDDGCLRLKPGARMEGYFQSERYFADFATTIRADFTPRAVHLAEIDAMAERLIPSSPCVSLHVRRGDYANPETMAIHGMLDASYYERALKILAERTGSNLPICVFTDDPAWVRANLALPGQVRFISEDTHTALQDMILMSRCTHHVTANSSFSWWGAWLNPSQDKIVVTPARWFQPASGLDTKDLVPSRWLRA
jgi:hypothetical protein